MTFSNVCCQIQIYSFVAGIPSAQANQITRGFLNFAQI